MCELCRRGGSEGVGVGCMDHSLLLSQLMKSGAILAKCLAFATVELESLVSLRSLASSLKIYWSFCVFADWQEMFLQMWWKW